MSNHYQRGRFELHRLDTTFKITFAEPFDVVCKVFLVANQPVTAKEHFIHGTGMTVLSSVWEGRQVDKSPVIIDWNVEGLKDIHNLPNWYVLFYGAITNAFNRLYKPALLDYATSFEPFLEEFLLTRLTAKYGASLSEMLMRRMWRVEDRCRDLLDAAIGQKLSARNDIYQPWDQYVRNPRNRIMHGEKFVVDKTSLENAHQAVYQAISWIECSAAL